MIFVPAAMFVAATTTVVSPAAAFDGLSLLAELRLSATKISTAATTASPIAP